MTNKAIYTKKLTDPLTMPAAPGFVEERARDGRASPRVTSIPVLRSCVKQYVREARRAMLWAMSGNLSCERSPDCL
jgi:hypothetical protein